MSIDENVISDVTKETPAGVVDISDAKIPEEKKSDGKKIAAKKKEKKKKAPGKASSKKKSILPEIVKDLHFLNSDLEKIFEIATLKLKSRVEEITSLFEEDLQSVEKSALPSMKEINLISKKLKSIKIKPKKGRIKDILKIENIIDFISGKLPGK